MGKSTISMAIFNSYVKLPEGRMIKETGMVQNPVPLVNIKIVCKFMCILLQMPFSDIS